MAAAHPRSKSRHQRNSRRDNRIKALDIAIFTRQLATMLQTGIPLLQACELAAGNLQNPALRTLATTLQNDVAAGSTFTAALRQHPHCFDALFCNLVEAGELSGTLDQMLERLASCREKAEALRTRVKKALQYPVAVIAIALIVSGILLVKVVPQFAATFASFGAELPLLTQQVLRLSALTTQLWPWLLLGSMLGVLGLRELPRRSPRVQDALERLSLRLPVLGAIVAQAVLARVTRTVATTYTAGLPLPEALRAGAGAAGNVVYRQALLQVREALGNGMPLAYSLRVQRLFPPLLLQLVAIGEEAGALDAMLERCAAYYEAEVDSAINGLSSLLEPLIMALLGLLVGGLMVAMYLPIFQIGAVV
jgi:type IV pilus assembly protein PilC